MVACLEKRRSGQRAQPIAEVTYRGKMLAGGGPSGGGALGGGSGAGGGTTGTVIAGTDGSAGPGAVMGPCGMQTPPNGCTLFAPIWPGQK